MPADDRKGELDGDSNDAFVKEEDGDADWPSNVNKLGYLGMFRGINQDHSHWFQLKSLSLFL